ncbi:MAG: GNAT family N-acetyltransferase [Acidimicrobiales bacterium]
MPHWFGIPEAVEDYVTVADRSPTVIASIDGEDVGLLTLISHGEYSAEIYLMAVAPGYHRQGIGHQMIQFAEALLARAGVEYLQVKTLSSRRPDAGYEKTRAFYLAVGFRPLEELPMLWGLENPALQMVKAIEDRSTADREDTATS